MFFKSNKLLGLDIGTNSVKVAEINPGRKGATITNVVLEPVPNGVVSGGEVMDPVALGSVIRAAVSRMNTKRTKVAASIWGAAVIVKKITLPRMDEKLVAQQIQFEAEQYIPFDKSEINLEFQILETRQNPESMDVLLVGAKKDLVFRTVEAVMAAGLECDTVDVAGFALANTFFYNYGKEPGRITALINVGSGVSNFVVVDGGDVVFSRDIPAGGSNYTGDIQKNMGVSWEEAESLKISACTGQAAPPEVQEVLNSVNESVADEIKRTFEFYLATAGEGASIQNFFLCGGASQTPGLKDTIARVLGSSLETMNPFLKITIEPKSPLTPDYLAQVKPFGAVVVGLGLREAGDR